MSVAGSTLATLTVILRMSVWPGETVTTIAALVTFKPGSANAGLEISDSKKDATIATGMSQLHLRSDVTFPEYLLCIMSSRLTTQLASSAIRHLSYHTMLSTIKNHCNHLLQ
jgi:hypothetical protein